MSLINSWLADRQFRQQAAIQRQQSVQQILSDLQQTRHELSSRLHSDLMLFRAQLTHQEAQRRADSQSFQAELQHDRQLLQQETAEFLGRAAADRELMAQQLATELQTFHQALQANVRSLRLTHQHGITTLKADTQVFLTECQEHRSQLSANTQQDLQRSRRDREAAVAALLADLSDFRAQLRQFRQSLSQAVWGQPTSVEPNAPKSVTVPKVSAIPPTTAIAVSPVAPKPTAAKSALPGKPATLKAPTKPVSNSVAKKVGAPPVSMLRSPAPAPHPGVPDEVPFEKEIYTFLHENHGARLTQIETALNANRFQAVDALRSLIKKGLVTQRDRVYLLQEPQ